MNFFSELMGVILGGAVGCAGRFLLSRWIQMISHHKDYPWGIFVCNVLGCLLVGILAGILIYRLGVGSFWRAFLFIGFLGGFTTFSSFSIDTITLLQEGAIFPALSNLLLTLVFCLIATAGGLLMTKSLMVS